MKFASFNDAENCTIHWLGGFYVSGHSRKWYIRIYTNQNGFIWYHYVPAGLAPLMCMGAKFDKGSFIGVKKGFSSSFHIHNLQKFEYISFKDLPKGLWSAGSNPAVKGEVLLKYSVGSKNYFLPQMELIRVMFCLNTTMTNFLLMPEGLSQLCSIRKIENDDVHVEIHPKFTEKNTCLKIASLLASVHLDERMNAIWHSVGRYARKPEDGKLMYLPDIADIKVYFKGLYSGNNYLIHRISGVKGLPKPFDNVYYTHKVNKYSSNTESIKKVNKPERDNNHEHVVTDNPYSSEASNKLTSYFESVSATLDFDRPIRGKRIDVDVEKDACKVKINAFNVKPEDEMLSVGVSVKGGGFKPLEINNLNIHDAYSGKNIYGLEDFLRAIEHLKTMMPVQDVRIGSLFGDRKFVMLDEKTRRPFALVFLHNAFILEVARPDEHSISTLILKNVSEDYLKLHFRQLMKSMLDHGGHWDFELLNDLFYSKFSISKHMQFDSSQKWACQLFSKICI